MAGTNNAINVKMTAQSEATIRKLAGSDAMPELRRGMRLATQPLAPAAKRAARNTPSKRGTKRGVDSLRRAVANSIGRKMKLSTKKVLVIIAGMPKGGKSNLGSVLDGQKPWIHPTYGHDPRVTQESHPFFEHAIEQHEAQVTREMQQVLDRFERTL